MPRHYLQPEELVRVVVEGLPASEIYVAIAEAIEEARISEATVKAVKILHDAGIEVDNDSIARLHKLI